MTKAETLIITCTFNICRLYEYPIIYRNQTMVNLTSLDRPMYGVSTSNDDAVNNIGID